MEVCTMVVNKLGMTKFATIWNCRFGRFRELSVFDGQSQRREFFWDLPKMLGWNESIKTVERIERWDFKLGKWDECWKCFLLRGTKRATKPEQDELETEYCQLHKCPLLLESKLTTQGQIMYLLQTKQVRSIIHRYSSLLNM